MNKLKILKDILEEYDKGIESRPGAVAYESDRLIQGIRYILDQPDEVNLDIVKPTASEVQQAIEDQLAPIRDNMKLWEEQLGMLLEIENERITQKLDLQELIDEAKKELNGDIEKLRAANRLHIQNYHSGYGSGNSF